MATVAVSNTTADLSGSTLLTEEKSYTITGSHTYTTPPDLISLTINGTANVITSARVADFVSLNIGGTETIDSDRDATFRDLLIDQGALDTVGLKMASSDVTHARTTYLPTDQYFGVMKQTALEGGAEIRVLAEDSVSINAVLRVLVAGGQADTAKTAGAVGLVNFNIEEHDGADGVADIAADGNIFALRCRQAGSDRTVWVVDEDGDFHYDGADGGAYDEFDDAMMLRAFSLAASGRGVIRTHWDSLVQYGEKDLVDAGILGDTVANGGLVNGAQLQRFLVGAAWQLYTKVQEQAERIGTLEQKLLGG
jgi:hypothetical protein